jgi:hypothetical protein
VKSQHEFLRDMVSLLTQAGIPYMVTGSLAATYHGRPRTTQDIDLVVEVDAERLRLFVESAIRGGYYVDPDDAKDALTRRSMFNILDSTSGYKLDIIIRKDREYSREEFRRRRTTELPGGRVFMVSPEDSILSKLEWAKKSSSERQYQDALGIVLVQGGSLDVAYLRRWADALGVQAELESLLASAPPRETQPTS